MELQFPLVGPIQKGLLFLQPTPQPQDHSIIDHLKTSLSSNLDFFYLLSDRLGTSVNDDNTIYFFIDCNGPDRSSVYPCSCPWRHRGRYP
ncbi:hypothetical protein VitviT2T_011000 [Vitis vinifera]|uniref:Uncharacterized protein n=1 Tax=Vitis vinifera TaxID=29760 RepID=A0ABY9CA99_VITVI|nr:hypothetical protein VitviT2T_011000 [Vitis vinifera]